jgi:hypothetical protein
MGTRLNLILRRFGIIGLVALWSGIVVATYGTHLKSESSQLKQYEREVMDRAVADHPGKDLAPGLAVGLACASAWEFVGAVSGFLGFILTSGLVVLREMYGWEKTAARIGTGILASFALLGVCPNINSGLGNFRWGFDTLGAGEWIIAAGLLLVAVGPFSLTRDSNSDPARNDANSPLW